MLSLFGRGRGRKGHINRAERLVVDALLLLHFAEFPVVREGGEREEKGPWGGGLSEGGDQEGEGVDEEEGGEGG